MHKTIVQLSLLLSCLCLHGQEASTLKGAELFFSVNRTTLFDSNTENRTGMGAGFNVFFNQDRRVTVYTGFEYNFTRQYKYQLYQGHWCRSYDWEVGMHLLTIPIGLRYRIGKEKRFFVENAVFIDIPYTSFMDGRKCCTDPDSLLFGVGGCNQVVQRGMMSFGLGLSLGIGYRIPFSKVDLVIKPDYKYVLNELYSYLDAINNRYIRLNVILKFK